MFFPIPFLFVSVVFRFFSFPFFSGSVSFRFRCFPFRFVSVPPFRFVSHVFLLVELRLRLHDDTYPHAAEAMAVRVGTRAVE